MKTIVPTLDYATYTAAWNRIATDGLDQLNVDTWASGRRYLSLATLALEVDEAKQLRDLTSPLTRLIDVAVEGMLKDPEWWSALAWPWSAIELARQEPAHPDGLSTLYGRFDCLLDLDRVWQIIEFNADTPSGGREASGLEPRIAKLAANDGLRSLDRSSVANRLVSAIQRRLASHPRSVGCIGVISSHTWLEDMAQATWLAWRLRRVGLSTLVGDVNDLATSGRRITLRGQPIDALYRFYPLERLYRHAVFASLCEAAIDGRLLMLNGLRAFVAQSKACLAWLWANLDQLGPEGRTLVKRHLPQTLLARDQRALGLLPHGVVKHVNGREGDSVVFGNANGLADWEGRLLEGGYVVQRVVDSIAVDDVAVDDLRRTVKVVSPRVACVGAFSIDGQFGGCYTRLDGPITSARATYVATLRAAS